MYFLFTFTAALLALGASAAPYGLRGSPLTTPSGDNNDQTTDSSPSALSTSAITEFLLPTDSSSSIQPRADSDPDLGPGPNPSKNCRMEKHTDWVFDDAGVFDICLLDMVPPKKGE